MLNRHTRGAGSATLAAWLGPVAVVVAMVTAMTTGLAATASGAAAPAGTSTPLQIILMIGDGMGHAHLDLLRSRGPAHLNELHMLASLRTASLSGITDSAAAATALSTGERTVNGRLSVSPGGHPWPSLFERARRAGLRLGLVTTVAVTDATPAAFAAHAEDRRNHRTVAGQYLDLGVDVILGGGGYHWTPSLWPRRGEVAPLDRATAMGYAVVRRRDELLKLMGGPLPPGQRLLGLFSDSSMAYEAERPTHEPSLAEMTDAALRVLSRDNAPFVLVVEAGRIDHLGHEGRADALAAELSAFDAAVDVALRYLAEHPEALLVVTADHETGGLKAAPTGEWRFTRAGGHTDAPVPLLAKGAGAEYLSGALHLADVGGTLAQLVDSWRDESTAITVMTFNIHGGIGSDLRYDLERLQNLLKESGADIIALNEVEHGSARVHGDRVADLLARALGYEHVFAPTLGTAGSGFGNALLSRFPILTRTTVPLPGKSGSEPRNVIWATLDVDGTPLNVLVTHFSTPSEGNGVEQARAIERLAFEKDFGGTGGPAVLLGDLNFVPMDSLELASLSRRFMDSWPLYRLLSAPWWLSRAGFFERDYRRGGYTYDAFDPSRRIDYVLTTPGLLPDPAGPTLVWRTMASDHLPYQVTLRLPRRHSPAGLSRVRAVQLEAYAQVLAGTTLPPPSGRPVVAIHAGEAAERWLDLLGRHLPDEVARIEDLVEDAGMVSRRLNDAELSTLASPAASGVSLLVLPYARELTARQEAALRRFVAEGGGLLALDEAGLLPAVQELVGFRLAGWQFCPLGAELALENSRTVPPRGFFILEPFPFTQVLGTWMPVGPQYAANRPLVVARGRAAYAAGFLFAEEVMPEDPVFRKTVSRLLGVLTGTLPRQEGVKSHAGALDTASVGSGR